jgi:CelD/BcsL family acetyltransferase involved in cellulose biosynthesis
MDIKPWDQMIMLLKKKRRSSARQAVRRSEEDGLHSRLVGAEDAERAARRLVALHQTSWRGRGIGVEHTRRRFEAFMEAAVRRMTYGGLGAISEFQRDGETALSHFAVFGRDFIGGYMHGPSQEAAARYQISSLIIWDMANIARDKNLPYLNHLRGEEPYKLRWSSRVVPNHRLIMSRNPTGLAIYSGYQTLRLKINAYVSSKEAPRWIGKSVVRYRNLRSEAARHVKGVSE